MKKEKVFDYFLQLLMVVLGVFLGMMASEWSSNRSFKNDRKNVLLGLKNEMNNNLDYLNNRKEKGLMPFFDNLDSLSTYLGKHTDLKTAPMGDKAVIDVLTEFPGLGRPQLDDAMFDAAKFSNMLSHFDIELLKQLTRSYNLQHNIQGIRGVLAQKLVRIDSETRLEEVLDVMWEIMQDYYGAQYNLIKEYEETIKLIDDSLK